METNTFIKQKEAYYLDRNSLRLSQCIELLAYRDTKSNFITLKTLMSLIMYYRQMCYGTLMVAQILHIETINHILENMLYLCSKHTDYQQMLQIALSEKFHAIRFE